MCNVGVNGEEATKPNDTDQERQPNLEPFEGSKFASDAGLGVGCLEGDEFPHHGDGQQPDGAHNDEEEPPPEGLPTHVAKGTPMTLETVSPAITMEIAQPRLVGATSPAAMTAATPKKAPWGGSPEAKRDSSMKP